MQIALWVAFYILGVFLVRARDIWGNKKGLSSELSQELWLLSWIIVFPIILVRIILILKKIKINPRQWRLIKWFMGDYINKK